MADGFIYNYAPLGRKSLETRLTQLSRIVHGPFARCLLLPRGGVFHPAPFSHG
jgi:hypothetical protein